MTGRTTAHHDHEAATGATPAARNGRVLVVLLAVVFGMVGLAYASVPLYRLFCQVTGLGGTTQVGTNSYDMPVLDREMTISFNADTGRDLPWKFEPVQRRIKVKVGEEALAFYRVTNVSDREIVGTAVYNVTPFKAGPYFSKIECFCFTEQRLAPGESMDMPVTFFVDPNIDDDRNLDDVKEITLSYTFYPAKK
ncbi:MAG TPA: cytochrome c oxidase assembly protein [Sphingomonadales bacterium]